jgi:hypothetical protein
MSSREFQEAFIKVMEHLQQNCLRCRISNLIFQVQIVTEQCSEIRLDSLCSPSWAWKFQEARSRRTLLYSSGKIGSLTCCDASRGLQRSILNRESHSYMWVKQSCINNTQQHHSLVYSYAIIHKVKTHAKASWIWPRSIHFNNENVYWPNQNETHISRSLSPMPDSYAKP